MPPIDEELENIVSRDKDKQKYMFKTKFLGGTAVYPKFPAAERAQKFVELDKSAANYKAEFKEKLEKAWDETLKVTEPYRFDPWTNKRGSPDNIPEARNFGLRIGAIIARDQL